MELLTMINLIYFILRYIIYNEVYLTEVQWARDIHLCHLYKSLMLHFGLEFAFGLILLIGLQLFLNVSLFSSPSLT